MDDIRQRLHAAAAALRGDIEAHGVSKANIAAALECLCQGLAVMQPTPEPALTVVRVLAKRCGDERWPPGNWDEIISDDGATLRSLLAAALRAMGEPVRW